MGSTLGIGSTDSVVLSNIQSRPLVQSQRSYLSIAVNGADRCYYSEFCLLFLFNYISLPMEPSFGLKLEFDIIRSNKMLSLFSRKSIEIQVFFGVKPIFPAILMSNVIPLLILFFEAVISRLIFTSNSLFLFQYLYAFWVMLWFFRSIHFQIAFEFIFRSNEEMKNLFLWKSIFKRNCLQIFEKREYY